MGKFPHEFETCSDFEYEFLKAAWNEEKRMEKEASDKMKRRR
jgi:hypothetical protein